LRIADYLHGGLTTLHGEYELVIAQLCKLISISQGESGGGFIYQSAKDVLKWHNLSVKKHISVIMSIGNLYLLPEKQFEKYKNDNNYIGITKEELKAFMEG